MTPAQVALVRDWLDAHRDPDSEPYCFGDCCAGKSHGSDARSFTDAVEAALDDVVAYGHIKEGS